MHVMSQIPYRENGAGQIVVGYVVVETVGDFVGRLVPLPSLDKLVLFRRQCMLGNHMSKRLFFFFFFFLEYSSYIK